LERDAAQTTRALRQKDLKTVYATPRVNSSASISNLRVRTPTIGKEASMLKHVRSINEQAHTIRLARIGPGFVIGTLQFCASSFNYNQGIYTAVTPSRLHFLSNESVIEIEEEYPILALELYKMLAQLAAERQAATIDQLATLQSIMVSLAPSKPVDRMTMAAIRQAMKAM